MKVKSAVCLFVVLCVLLLSGCSDYQIENMDILTTYFADEKDGKIILGGGVANVRTLSDSMADKPVSLIFAEGKSLAEAEDNLKKSADHPLFYGGIRAVVVSDKFAENGIYKLAQSLKSDYKLRSESMFFITKKEPKKVITHNAINDFTGGFAAESLLKALGEEGRITYCEFSDVFEMQAVGKTGLAVATVDISDDIMRFDGYGIFNGEKLVGFTKNEQTEGVNIFLNEKASLDFYFNSDKYSIYKTAERKEAYFDGENLSFDVTFDFVCSADMTEDIKQKAEKNIRQSAEAAFKYCKDEGCDFLKLYRIFQKDYRFEFENQNYSELIKNAKLNLWVDIKQK